MNQQDFERHNEAYWQETEALIDSLVKTKQVNVSRAGEFPQRYRQVCQHLALARERQYTSHLIERLNRLMLRGHQHLYGAHAGFISPVLHFIGAVFPALVRREWRLFWLAFFLFYGPAVVMGWAAYERPEMSYTLMSQAQVAEMEAMYRPDAPHIGRERGAENDFYMFGVYIWNNIRIGFQTFAGGIFFGVGSIFFLVFNGLYIGVVAGHLTEIGYTATFWSFVAGHGSFELTAIVLSGMAGLKLGFALLAPGRRTRLEALREAAKISIKIVYGVIGMLVIAAFIEAFWSASTLISPVVKYSVAGVLWSLVISYFLLVGRGHAD